MNFDCTVNQTDGKPVLTLSGELDLATADHLEAALRSVEKPDIDRVVVDLRGLAFMDSTGLRAVIAADSRAKRDGRVLELVRGNEAVHRVFRMTLLEDRFTFVEPTEADDAGGDGP